MKSDKHIVEQRVKDISLMLIRGSGREDIVQYSSEKYRVGIRQIDKYIAKARLLIEQSVKREVGYDYAKAVTRYEELYRLSMDAKDYRTALSVNKELSNLQGLSKQQIEHSGEVTFVCNIPD